MERLQAFKFELMPNGEQTRDMRRFAGASRFVFNRALAWQTEQYAKDKTIKFSYVNIANLLPAWKSELAWLSESPSQVLQQSLKDLERSYKNFFAKRAAFPNFKKRSGSASFRYPQGFKVDESNARLFLPKLGWIRYRDSRKVLGVAKNITLSHNGGKWFASIQTEREVAAPVPTATGSVGIDVGIARFATLFSPSETSHIAPLNSLKKHAQRLAKYQKRMARKVKFSRNWHKAKQRVQKVHTCVANARRDFLHKASTRISQNHALVCVEDLQVRNMSKSAKGKGGKGGKGVAQKRGLNKAILDQGWGEFRRQLQYKMDWAGGFLIAVPAQNTSKTCPCCGHIAKENRLTQAQFACVECGYENHADVVGAMNILERGHRLLACGEAVSRVKVAKPKRAASVKQEPTEGITQRLKPSHEPVGIPVL
jgi:putative transposase